VSVTCDSIQYAVAKMLMKMTRGRRLQPTSCGVSDIHLGDQQGAQK